MVQDAIDRRNYTGGVEVEVHTTQTSYDNASDTDGKLHVLAV